MCVHITKKMIENLDDSELIAKRWVTSLNQKVIRV